MQKTSNVISNDAFGRFVRRVVLGGAVVAAAAAVVVLGDNGVRTGGFSPSQASLTFYSQVEEPALACSQTAHQEIQLPAVEVWQARAETNRLNWLTNGVADPPVNAAATNAASCVANGNCTNKNLVVSFNFSWCCPDKTACYVKLGAGWLSWAQWLKFNVGGCVVRVGCK